MSKRLFSTLPGFGLGPCFSKNSIPKNQLVAVFSRSSGPGGQSVNKTNSKVDLRMGLSWLPPETQEKFRSMHASKINSLGQVFTACDVHRSQLQNYNECLEKVAKMVADCFIAPKETSLEKKKLVANLIQRDTARRRADKNHRSDAKSRRSGNRDY